MGSLGPQHIFDAGLNKPQRMWKKRVDPDTDEIVIEKKPFGRQAKYVDAKGNVKHVRLVNASAQKSDYRYEQRMRRDQRANNGIPYALCPLRDEDSNLKDTYFPAEMRTPCERHSYNEEKACPHVELIIKRRQAKNAEHQAKRLERFNRKERMEQQKLEATQAVNEKLIDVLEKISEKDAPSQAKRPTRKS